MIDKAMLVQSHAGVRLIALATLYNKGDFERLGAYISEHFNEAALAVEAAELRLDDLRGQFEQAGKVRVRQLLAYDKYHVVVMHDTQAGVMVLEDLQVEEDYPHKISAHTRQVVV
ncbi:MAG: hypothetical protein IH587_00805 [Anaerolineae bacterium]|nr:hypothetical protein [Anaerolineae bacterium]